jgi:hypothetical protein
VGELVASIAPGLVVLRDSGAFPTLAGLRNDENGRCGLCHTTLREHVAGDRLVLETARFATIAPYASR